MSKSKKSQSRSNRQTQGSRIDAFTTRLNGWSRRRRIILNTFVTIAVVLLTGLIVTQFVEIGTSNEANAWLAVVGIGIAVYAIGWYLLVGFDWDDGNPWQARLASTWFILLGIASFGLSVIGLLVGLLLNV